MKIWLFTHNFPPEVNACANRAFEHGKYWARSGVELEVFTDVPHFPEGRVYNGYRNRYTEEYVEGMRIHRVPSFIAANRRKIRRILSYVSYMISAVVLSLRTGRKPDVVLATSPQIFTGVAGYLVSRALGRPFVLEVRDLWPQSIKAVKAINLSFVLKLIQIVVDYLYRRADLIVIVSEGFRSAILSSGISEERVVYVPNGIDDEALPERIEPDSQALIKERYGLTNKFVFAYVGTVGMAHGLEVMINAARTNQDEQVHFLIVGAGADWDSLQALTTGLSNCSVLQKLDRQEALSLLAACDASFIHLRDNPTFRTVIPSKMFEAMALGKPILLGVEGQAAKLLERAQAGLTLKPECPEDLNRAIAELRMNTRDYGENGRRFVTKYHSRCKLSSSLLEHIRSLLR